MCLMDCIDNASFWHLWAGKYLDKKCTQNEKQRQPMNDLEQNIQKKKKKSKHRFVSYIVCKNRILIIYDRDMCLLMISEHSFNVMLFFFFTVKQWSLHDFKTRQNCIMVQHSGSSTTLQVHIVRGVYWLLLLPLLQLWLYKWSWHWL